MSLCESAPLEITPVRSALEEVDDAVVEARELNSLRESKAEEESWSASSLSESSS